MEHVNHPCTITTIRTGIILLLTFCTFPAVHSVAQSAHNDSVRIDYQKIYAYCLDGNIAPACKLLELYSPAALSLKDLKFKTDFENRFRGSTDNSDFMESRKSPVSALLEIFRDYWRMSLLDNSKNYDSVLTHRLAAFLATSYPRIAEKQGNLPDDSLDTYLKRYITSAGYHTTGFGRTGKYLDLLVWKNQKDTAFKFNIRKEQVSTQVVFMDDFVTLGWEEYATLGRAYPGGWATKEALYCVRKAYDLKSEDFLIRYLCHEGRHFTDYKLFPKLTSADLEYRAKLTELSLLNKSLYKTIGFFIDNANYESENGHSVANYCVIRDLSGILFKSDFEKDITQWEKVSREKIQDAAYDALTVNTKALKKLGPGVTKYIKK